MTIYIIIAAVCIFAVFAVLIVKKYGGLSGGKDEGNKSVRLSSWAVKNIPIDYYDIRKDAYVLDDGSYMDIVMIRAKDLLSSNESEVEYDCLKFAKFYKIYADDFKIISMNFPCNTHKQQQYWQHKEETATNEVFKAWCAKYKEDLRLLEKEVTTREYYLMCFSKDETQHEKNISMIYSVLSSGREGLVQKIPAEKKHQILFKLNNKNSLIA